MTEAPPVSTIGAVLIGRNEGQRLLACLASIVGNVSVTVYVDSGSTDGSTELARNLGAEVVVLDMQRPFTAARARNAGFQHLQSLAPYLAFVQFVDGDCELRADWLPKAVGFLNAHPDVAGVCGRRRERFPGRSVYNQLCDIEWDTPVGETRACGGDVLMRSAALQQVNGYREDLIAGEEPELCIRLRRCGWRIWRLDAEMTWHDAAIVRIGQWWQRAVRGGYAFAQGVNLHGAAPELHWVRESRSAWLWGAIMPLGIFLSAILVSKWWALCAAVYPIQAVRMFLRTPGTFRIRAWRAIFLVLGKFAEAWGQVTFTLRRWSGSRVKLIEYK